MKRITLTTESLDFANKSKQLVGQVLENVYYSHDEEGFINTRKMGERDFEYVPLSRLYLKMKNGFIYKFSNSLSFLNYDGFYTLDFKAIDQPCEVIQDEIQSDYLLWRPYIEKQIENVTIEWSRLRLENYEIKLPDIYPKCINLQFDNNHELIIVASEIDLDKKNTYSFRCPDEAIVIFFSKKAYHKYFSNDEKS